MNVFMLFVSNEKYILNLWWLIKTKLFFKFKNKLFQYMPKSERVCTETENLDEYRVYYRLNINSKQIIKLIK
jgi:hypothetical protein